MKGLVHFFTSSVRNRILATLSLIVLVVLAAIVGALAIGERIGPNLIIGLAAVAFGIWLATSSGSARSDQAALAVSGRTGNARYRPRE